ncbi:MAG: carbohydrate kinase family protein [Thermoplasmata archaeon]|nr:MAG: carbohydrate kinase family protein [Thermoplasmata archaeon]
MGPEADVDVVGFGALNLDVIYKVDAVEEAGLSPGAEVIGDEGGMDTLSARLEEMGGPPVSVTAGGSAANTVHALRTMGVLTGYVGAVGDDEAAGVLTEGLGDPMYLGLVRRGRSGRTVIAVGPDGDRSITVFPNVNDTLAPADVDQLLMARSRIVHMSSFVGDLPLEAQVEAVRRLPKDITVSIDPGALYALRGAEGIAPLLERADVVLPGEGELLLLTGAGDRHEAAGMLMDMGVGTVVVKLGARGIHTYWAEGEHHLRSLPVSVAGDSVGAGDVADAGYLAGMLARMPPADCTLLAHMCAVESLAGHGRETYPDKDFLATYLDEMKARGR